MYHGKYDVSHARRDGLQGQNTKQSRFCCHIVRGHVTDRHVISNNENIHEPLLQVLKLEKIC